jgi:hypothetical protein
MKLTKKTKLVVVASILSLSLVAVGGQAVYSSHVSAASNSSEAADTETNDDNKTTTANVQDNGQDGEAADSANQ